MTVITMNANHGLRLHAPPLFNAWKTFHIYLNTFHQEYEALIPWITAAFTEQQTMEIGPAGLQHFAAIIHLEFWPGRHALQDKLVITHLDQCFCHELLQAHSPLPGEWLTEDCGIALFSITQNGHPDTLQCVKSFHGVYSQELIYVTLLSRPTRLRMLETTVGLPLLQFSPP
ncbi:hypothetical protein Hypma_009699 [Hypsizygus marmoreus]|uniref:Uncharacterized protein n=1 Tax=Hypsizygus marmoreus TaxID=39966 RepID=A0A369JRH8_HYPMA|nr:hypothetical protein Hypma_009699 [Hypsizygus marmoreus]